MNAHIHIPIFIPKLHTNKYIYPCNIYTYILTFMHEDV